MYSIIEQFDVIVRSSRIEKRKSQKSSEFKKCACPVYYCNILFEKSNHSKYLKYDGCNDQM